MNTQDEMLTQDEQMAFEACDREHPVAAHRLKTSLVEARIEANALREELAEVIREKLDLLEQVQEQLRHITDWANAYPVDVFIEPQKEDWKKANEVLNAAGLNFTALNGATMRHVINGVKGYAEKAAKLLLEAEEKE